jgi:hypothetical protein
MRILSNAEKGRFLSKGLARKTAQKSSLVMSNSQAILLVLGHLGRGLRYEYNAELESSDRRFFRAAAQRGISHSLIFVPVFGV